MRWFRMHSDAIANPKLKLIAFEDRWHFVAVCCMKAEGLLDEDRDDGLRDRLIAAQLGLTVRESDEVRRRLVEVDLIRDDWHPKGWAKYQYESDNSSDRVRRYREKKQQDSTMKRYRNVSVTPPDTDTDTETDSKEKKKARKRAVFVKPDITEVAEYCGERNNTVSADAFVSYYESNGWRVGKNPMKDWKAAVRTWEKRNETTNGTARKPVWETPADRRRQLDEAIARAEGVAGVEADDGNVRGQILEGVWSRAE